MAIVVLDFGGQTAQLIARRVREVRVYSEILPWDAPEEQALAVQPSGFILSGGPASVYEPGAPQVPHYVFESGLPVLGICYGLQAMTHALGGRVAAHERREFGHAVIRMLRPNPLLPDGETQVWMSHGDRIEVLPPGFAPLAASGNSPVAAMGDLERRYFGVQFHPEVAHTLSGAEILRRFAVEVCGARADWAPESIISKSVREVREQVGEARVLSAVSGGVVMSKSLTNALPILLLA